MPNYRKQQNDRRDGYEERDSAMRYSEDYDPYSEDYYGEEYPPRRRPRDAEGAAPSAGARIKPQSSPQGRTAAGADKNSKYDLRGSRNILIALLCLVAAILIAAALFAGGNAEKPQPPQPAPVGTNAGTVPPADPASSSDAPSPTDTPTPPVEVMKLPEPTPITDEEVLKKLDSVAKRHGLFTMQIATIKNGEVSHTYEYGTMDKESGRAPNSDTKIRLASLSKVITGISAMSMVEKGIIDLDGDVSKIAGYTIRNPYYPDNPVTMRSLLCHTSTISTVNLDVNAQLTTDTGWLPAQLQRSKPFTKYCPGKPSAFEYSNSGYCIAGYLQEKAVGKTLNQYLRETFLDRMGIDAAFCASQLKDTGNIAALRNNEPNSYGMSVKIQLERPYYDAPGDNSYPYAGDYMSSAKDFARMLCILINGGTYNGVQFLSPETVSAMLDHQVNTGDRNTPRMQCITLKYYREQLGNRDLYYHTGAANGVQSYAAFDKDTRDGVVIITIGSDTTKKDNDVNEVCLALAEHCFGL